MKRCRPTLAALLALLPACGGGGDGSATMPVLPFANAPRGDGPATDTTASGAPGSRANPDPLAPSGTRTGSETSAMGVPLDMAANAAGDGPLPAAAPLPRSAPEAQGVRSEGILALVNALDGGIDEVHSLMLVRHGQVVAEAWWSPYAASDIHVLYSGTKSFNATAVGFLVQEGLLSVDDLVLSFFPDLAPAAPSEQMRNMRVRDLLTMSTGHQADTMDTLRARSDGAWTRAFLETEVQNAPGSLFVYNSGAAYLLGAIVQRVSGTSVESYLTPRLFEPLGIQQHLWGMSPEGVNLTDGGLSLRTEDFAKFGLLYLQRGSWNGQRLLSEQWVADATARAVSTGNDDGNWNYGYGYQFWRNPVGGYRADGSLGQFAFVLPEQDLVLAITSGTNDTNGLMNIVWANLLPALAPDALPDNPAARAALEDRLRSLSLTVPSGAESSPLATQVSGRYTAEPNSQGITAVSVDFVSATPTLTIEDADGSHGISVGRGEWVRGRTGFKKRINELFDTPDQGIAAIGAWSAEDTFLARLCFTETPYTAIANLKFEDDRVLLDISYNVRWGAAAEPRVTGTR